MSIERSVIREIMSSGGTFEPFLKNVDGGGRKLASMPMALERVARYIALAQDGELEKLHADIERVMNDTPEYLAQMVLGLSIVLGQYAHARGRSFIPIIETAAKEWGDLAPSLRIWR